MKQGGPHLSTQINSQPTQLSGFRLLAPDSERAEYVIKELPAEVQRMVDRDLALFEPAGS